MNNHAPIALFVYDRIEQTRVTIESLRKNYLAEQSDLFIFSDAAKDPNARLRVDAVRDYIKKISGFKQVVIFEKERNYGLKKSIEYGVNYVLSIHSKIIVIEDDLSLSPFFLNYMNEALIRYENEARVMQVSGYAIPNSIPFDTDAFFLPFITSWGWGTWRRAWNFYSQKTPQYECLKTNERLRRQFDLNGKIKYFEMLEKGAAGKIESWAINWYFVTFMKDGLTLYPRRSMVENVGFDGSGVNCRFHTINQAKIDLDFEVKKFPKLVENSIYSFEYIESIPQLRLSFNSVLKRIIGCILK